MLIKKHIEDIIDKLKHQNGHRFLYSDFPFLVLELKKCPDLSREDLISLSELVDDFLLEAEQYSSGYPYYPLWATKCLDCASIIMDFIPDSFVLKKWSVDKMKELVNRFTKNSILSEFAHTELFRRHIEEITVNNPEDLWKVASNCFFLSDEGGRPRYPDEEVKLYEMMVIGYELANRLFLNYS